MLLRVLVVALAGLLGAGGVELGVMTSGAFTAPYLELKPVYERDTGNTLVTLATTMGAGSGSIPARLERGGEPVDVVIMDEAALDELIRKGLVVGKVQLARSSIGMAVRKGAVKPDISSVEALKKTLLEAKSIAYSFSVSGQYLSGELFPRLGIAEQIAAKCMKIDKERVGNVVARGEAEIGFQQVSELLPIAGIDFVGPLPAEVQRITVFAAGAAAGSKHPSAARELMQFLSSPPSAGVITKTGMEAVNGQ